MRLLGRQTPLGPLLRPLLALLLVGALIIEVLIWQVGISTRSQAAQQLLSRGAEVRSALETRLRDGIYLTRGLVSFLQSQNGLRDPERVEAWLASMRNEVDYLINIGIAPDNRIALIYPREGNEAALGLAYSEMPTQWPIVQQIVLSGEPALAGPLPLVQGGSGLIYRSPVYLDGRYWGLVSTVMDASALLGMLQSDPRWQDLNLQLQRQSAPQSNEFVRIWGDDLNPDAAHQTMLLRLPGTLWRLSVQQRSAGSPLRYYHLALYGLLLLVLVAVGWTLLVRRREQAEREALRSETERMKNEFVSTINHELRTPLTSILGTLSLLHGGAVGSLSPEAGRLVSLAKHNGEHLLKLISDLLDIDKLQAGSMPMDLQAVALDQVLPNAMQGQGVMLMQAELKLECDNAFPGACVRADPTRLRQVLDNLLSNAIKFSPPGGTVSLRVSPDQQGRRWRIAVEDQGAGIAPAFQTKVFERFTQADGSSQRKAGGTGLGLAISRALVERMGGEIGFTSAASGSCFYILLPAA
ncbi:MAG: ATP-binding protein [Halopseudomonas sp.]|uniref:ATP-binding protein n=1 Tax=Halopseudomonas sp. TaxID=2901191 RepID=UPI003002D6BA